MKGTSSSRTLEEKGSKRFDEIDENPPRFEELFEFLKTKKWGFRVGDRPGLSWVFLRDSTLPFERNSQTLNKDIFESREAVIQFVMCNAPLMKKFARFKIDEDRQGMQKHLYTTAEDAVCVTGSEAAKFEWESAIPEILNQRNFVPQMKESHRLHFVTYSDWRALWYAVLKNHGGTEVLKRIGLRKTETNKFEIAHADFSDSALVQLMIRLAHITASDNFIDLGSGIGAVALQVAVLARCVSIGLERELNRFRVSQKLQKTVYNELDCKGFHRGECALLLEDFTSRRVQDLINNASVVLLNNSKLTLPESEFNSLMDFAQALCRGSKPGTRFVSFERIPSFESENLRGSFHHEEAPTLPHVVGWTAASMLLHVYTKLA